MKKLRQSIISVLAGFAFLLSSAQAIETAPRITDREIIESLAEIKQGQININRRLDDFNQRFVSIDNRFESTQNMIVALFASVMGLIIALIGYMIWDRKTAQQPLRERIGRLEEGHQTIDTHLDMQNPSGPVMQRVLAAFRKLAETDEKVAAILRSYSLL